MTNYEHIKAMSVEEMAENILKGISSVVCDYCPYNSYSCEMSYSFCVCKTESEEKQVVAKWLNSEVKNEKTI